jgi:hypothetical protein
MSRIGLWRGHIGEGPRYELDTMFSPCSTDYSFGLWMLVLHAHRRFGMSLGVAQAEHRIACHTSRKSLDCWARNSSCRSSTLEYQVAQ